MILSANTLLDTGTIITNGYGAKAQVGYDLTLKDVKLIGQSGAIAGGKTKLPVYYAILPNQQPDSLPSYTLKRGVYSIEFDQGCNLDDQTMAFITHRSSLARIGATITSGIYDPGFQCETVGAILTVNVDWIIVEQHARIAQFVAQRSQPSELYNGQWQGAKDVK